MTIHVHRCLHAGVLGACSALAVAACAATDGSVEIGPEGGFVLAEDGLVELRVPAGALAEPTQISARRVDDGPDDAVGPTVALYPLRLVLRRPAELTYDAEGLGDGLVLVGLTKAGWTRLPDAEAEDTLLRGSIVFFTTVAPAPAR